MLTEDQIKHMASRFLGWSLPEDFQPDAGITFKPTFNDHLPTPMQHNPTGTNLFTASQAEAMVRYMVDDTPTEVQYVSDYNEARRRAGVRQSAELHRVRCNYDRKRDALAEQEDAEIKVVMEECNDALRAAALAFDAAKAGNP